ncbi:MAG: O-antigen ligase family protein [Bacteroidetes bacterium]|nr:O-antigen ligase family protein [Bacteroidota bacterium]
MRKVNILMLIMLFVMTAGYFTWSESLLVTRLLKVVGRLSVTVGIWYIFRMLVKKGAATSFRWQNNYSPLLYAGYLGLGMISILWSTDKGYSLLQWFMDFESLVFAFYFMRCFMVLDEYYAGHSIRFYNLLGNTAYLLLLIFVIGMYVAPDTFFRMTHGGEEARLGGFIMNPNELGMLCGVGVSCLLFDIYRKHYRVMTIIKIAVMAYALLMTGSRSSLVGLLLIAFFHIRQSKNIKLKLMMYAVALAAIPIAVTKLMIKENGGGVEEVMSMTGRLPFWTALLNEAFPKEPLLGFGFMRIYYTDTFQGANTYAGHMTHNTFMQVLMNLGIIGFSIALFQLIFTIKGFLSTTDQEKKLVLMGILIPVIINSFTEFGIFGETNYGILFYQLLIFSVSMQKAAFITRREKLYLRKTRPELLIH